MDVIVVNEQERIDKNISHGMSHITGNTTDLHRLNNALY